MFFFKLYVNNSNFQYPIISSIASVNVESSKDREISCKGRFKKRKRTMRRTWLFLQGCFRNSSWTLRGCIEQARLRWSHLIPVAGSGLNQVLLGRNWSVVWTLLSVKSDSSKDRGVMHHLSEENSCCCFDFTSPTCFHSQLIKFGSLASDLKPRTITLCLLLCCGTNTL